MQRPFSHTSEDSRWLTLKLALLVGALSLTSTTNVRGVTPEVFTGNPEELAARLVETPENAEQVVRGYGSGATPAALGNAAETLWRLAQKGRLSDDLARLAGEWLDAEDPFVRALSEWALSIKIGLENGGTVKYLRISQRVGWPLDDKIGAMRWIPGNAWENRFGFWAWSPVRVIGTVPVEEDGSAFFEVPANEAVYFQALDENHMEVRRMRSHVTLQPGETRGCVGCHETKAVTPTADWQTPLAMQREPSVPKSPVWGADRLLGYEWMVQPIFDRHCTDCHGTENPDGGIDLSATVADDGLMQSFRTIFGKRPDGKRTESLVIPSNRFSGAAVSRPMEFGSHKSKLIRTLLENSTHLEKVTLSPEEWQALVTWVDANGPYYDEFYNRRPAEGEPIRNIPVRFGENLARFGQ